MPGTLVISKMRDAEPKTRGIFAARRSSTEREEIFAGCESIQEL
jgi:hypothetical protein